MATGETFLELNAFNSSQIQTLVDVELLNAPYQALEATNVVDYNFKIESIVASIDIYSLPIAPIPPISPEDSMATRSLKVREIEQEYPKFGLTFYFWDRNVWRERATAVIQNRGAKWFLPLIYPYLSVGELKLLGKNSKLGVKITPFDNGTLTGDDKILINLDYTHENKLFLKPVDILSNTRSIGVDVGNIPVAIAPYQATRGLIWLQNSGEQRIYLWWGDSPTDLVPGNAPYIDPGSVSSYEVSRYRLPQAIWARTESGVSRIEGMEAY